MSGDREFVRKPPFGKIRITKSCVSASRASWVHGPVLCPLRDGLGSGWRRV